MKRPFAIIAILGALALALSCSPQAYNLSVDLRTPSKAGLSMSGKNVAIVYPAYAKADDSVFVANVSEGLAKALDDDYFGGKETVRIFSTKAGANYSSTEQFADLLVETGSDLIFLVDLTSLSQTSSLVATKIAKPKSSDKAATVVASYNFSMKLKVYDGMGVTDTLRVYNASSIARASFYTTYPAESREVLEEKASAQLPTIGEEVGEKCSKSFLSNWAECSFPIYYYEDDPIWLSAASAASSYRWKKAMDEWMSRLSEKSKVKRAAAEFNLAVVAFILGDIDLSEKWLNCSESEHMINEKAADHMRDLYMFFRKK